MNKNNYLIKLAQYLYNFKLIELRKKTMLNMLLPPCCK